MLLGNKNKYNSSVQAKICLLVFGNRVQLYHKFLLSYYIISYDCALKLDEKSGNIWTWGSQLKKMLSSQMLDFSTCKCHFFKHFLVILGLCHFLNFFSCIISGLLSPTVPCSAGHFSRTGLVPCYPCPRDYYQPEHGRSYCLSCPFYGTTTVIGATTIQQCSSKSPIRKIFSKSVPHTQAWIFFLNKKIWIWHTDDFIPSLGPS